MRRRPTGEDKKPVLELVVVLVWYGMVDLIRFEYFNELSEIVPLMINIIYKHLYPIVYLCI